ncbi:hypothetical protein AQUCO_01000689v1 [Aquilegia coerulea]|uniref:Kinesin motor domain-containing protein n=1 Tax=Aquilegia coerulea TaxID=218851 RepID=A0A2G5EBA9_AQUCA|nr:hypothetical protein AQUCO_01000689v1 [Aquilegia coerulea]
MMHFTPDPTRKVTGVGVTPSPSPFFTPRPERRRMDSRVFDANNLNRHQDRDRGEVNVQVLLRCRPLNDDEQRLNIPKVISCNEQRKEITVLQSIANKQVDRAFTFDKVFGPKAQQRAIYDHAISPIVNEVLEGFNCTVFAYGQTGTGKTYTMEGGMKTKGVELSAEAGVIPRAVRQIFDILEAQKADYSMKVTFLELYNEEITDLLAPEDCTRSVDDKQKKPISLMEDGKGGVIVRGLEEEVVYSANEIYSLLERGSSKRRTVDTLLNKHSSRSHAVFSITIHVKEATIGDEELIKCGKLNLVDLAGSENILRSGSREGRAREAGEINKSLLTLGRVINALVEHSAHIPYRDSKLTRLLRDSLGGKTKTCIIATISPSLHCLEETLSTLDYACRAKNIKNKPEVNQKMSKATLLKDLYLEMERMKQDVRAAREKNGVYIPHERFSQDEADKKAMNEKIEQLEIDIDLTVKKKLESCNKALHDLQENHRITISTLKEKEFIISSLLHSENLIIKRAKELRGNLQNASEDISVLSTVIDRKNKMESENHGLVLTFGSQLDQSLKNLHRTVLGSVSQQQQELRCMEEHIGSFLASKCDASRVLESRIEKVKVTYNSGVHAMKELAVMLQKESSSNLKQIESTILAQTLAVENFLVTAVKESEEVIQDIHGSLDEQKQLLAFSAQQQEDGLKRSLLSAQVISKETIEFFNNLHCSFSKLMKMIEEDQMEKSQQLASFGKTFQAESLIEEKLALDKIAVILRTLTSKKTDMVSKAMRNMDEENIEVKGRLEQKMFDVQKASSNAQRDWSEYIGNVQRQFVEDTFSAAEIGVTMESIIQECSKRVDDSRKQWEHAEMRVGLLNKEGTAKIRSIVEEKIHDNQSTLKEIRSLSSTTAAESDARVCNLLEVVSNSLQLDHETKKEIELMSTLCLGQLKSIQEKHSENISTIRNRADQCLTKEYLVDNITSTTCENRGIIVPTLESIEDLKTPSLEKLVAKMRPLNGSKSGNAGSKIHQEDPCSVSPNRTPFAAVN